MATTTRDHCVYDLDGWASQLAHGALLETLTVAATRFGCRARSSIASEDPSGHIVYKVVLETDPTVVEDSLVSVIRERVVQRQDGELTIHEERRLRNGIDEGLQGRLAAGSPALE